MLTKEKNYHKSVLIKEVVEGLQLKPHGFYIDATFGGGGHTKAILTHEPTCKVLAIDWDKTAIEKNEPPLKKEFGDRLDVAWGNFAQLYFILKKRRISHVDGILADFGTSQYQIHHKEGFSFQHETPLDMRMSPGHHQKTAANLINTLTEKELARIFFEFGEEPKARLIAKTIVAERKLKPFTTTKQLTDLIEALIPRHPYQTKKIHSATKVFQALRIVVNKELDNITIFLKAAIKSLSPGGRIACISFHSLEDRIVKTIFKENQDSLSIITKKPIIPTEREISQNPSSRSSKLRIAQKV